ncbi:MAG: glycosyltransferase family 4 protein [Chloroflexota bacterium]
MSSGSICVVPQINALAGPAAFSARLKTGLLQAGYTVHHDPARADTLAVLIIAGTRNIQPLWNARRRGARIVQRLNGINWIHRQRNTGLRHYLRAELGNLLLWYTRQWLAEHVVYQSHFVQQWWQRTYGKPSASSEVIWNGVDLCVFTPQGKERPPDDRVRVQVVEGHFKGGFEIGMEIAAGFAAALQRACRQPVELAVAGEANRLEQEAISRKHGNITIEWSGVVPPERIPALNRQAHLFLSTDLHAACPNAVIEALACGVPVVAFDTGALGELVSREAGRIAPYGGDAWKAELPHYDGLAQAALEILANQAQFRAGARAHAECNFSQERMCAGYLKALTG